MKHDVQVGRIDSIERLRNSENGNPRYGITLVDASSGRYLGTWNTAADHSLAYSVGNAGFRVGSFVTLIIGGRGTIRAMQSLSGSEA